MSDSVFSDFLDLEDFFLPGQSGLMHSSVLPRLIMGALHMVHCLPAYDRLPLGLRG